MKRPEDDKEFMEVVGHLISHPRFQKLDGIVQHHHSTRLEHSVNVSYTSYKIAKKFGWDAKSTARGGLLHDFFYYDWRRNWVGIDAVQRVVLFFMICFTTIGE